MLRRAFLALLASVPFLAHAAGRRYEVVAISHTVDSAPRILGCSTLETEGEILAWMNAKLGEWDAAGRAVAAAWGGVWDCDNEPFSWLTRTEGRTPECETIRVANDGEEWFLAAYREIL